MESQIRHAVVLLKVRATVGVVDIQVRLYLVDLVEANELRIGSGTDFSEATE
jgi:hypothetical protein